MSSLDVAMEFHVGKVTGISGDSGVGKTTILRILAGLTDPGEGSILSGGNVWFDKSKKINLTPQKRSLGFIFQDHQLFPNMSVFENLKFAASSRKSALEKMNYYLNIFGLSEFKNRMPNSLSGGQSKRAVIISALVRNPTLLLLDEPFAVLDEKMTKIVQEEILKYTSENACITVLVTHEISEIFKMTDYLYTIQKGKIISRGSPSKVFNSGASKDRISLAGIVIDNGVKKEMKGVLKIMTNGQVLEVSKTAHEFEIGDKILLSVGAEKIEITRPN